ncbi:MAG: TonB-dependent receptor [Pedobacter sp.]|nr:TonB-dependent receptor [Pedobacter sp.]MDQ8052024.1 TonB-dependent receptor [Pedobacter sp.]
MKQFVLLLLLLLIFGQADAQNVVIQGKVVDERNQPLSYSSVTLLNLQRSIFADSLGNFSFTVPTRTNFSTYNLRISSVGKKTMEISLSPDQLSTIQLIKLADLSLTLKEVEVNQLRSAQNSNSSILFNRQAIEQVQAFSLADILNNLPGKKLTPPDLQSPQNITLRSEAKGIQALSNALGIAIIMDDIQLSNNANMQSRNVGKWGVGGGAISSPTFGSFDVAFGGLDLRDIPTDNIESIEVITGVAPAKYGDLTDGAVIINRQAGQTPYQFSTRINGGSTNFSLSKGFKLNRKWGAINIGVNYLNSNENPSDKTKVYDRASTNVMWTSYPFKGIKNTLSVDYNTKIDNVKQDPDDGFDFRTYAKSRNLSISNRTAITLNHPIAKSINFSISYSGGNQETYNQRYINGYPEGISDKDVANQIYEGYFIPGNYTAVEHIKGNPMNINGNVSLANEVYTGKLLHQLSIGANTYFSKNNGEGVIVDPTKPRWANTRYQNDRPYDFESLPDVFNYGLYVQDQFKFKLFNREMSINPGIRYDVQNSQGFLQPRINARYGIAKDVQLTMAYGMSTKGPTLAHRYPAPTYIDLVLLNKYTGNVNESIVLFYTDKIIADNSELKSSQSNQLELGLQVNKRLFTTSIFGYFKDNFNGFSNNTQYRTYSMPQFDYTFVPSGRPIVTPNGLYTNRYVSISTVGNDLSSKNYGLEWGVSLKKIAAIQTSFDINTSFSYSTYHNAATRIVPASQNNIDLGKKAWFAIYPANNYQDWNLMSRVSTSTHIPKLGFVVNLLADIAWQTVSKTDYSSQIPIAYMDRYLNRYEITAFDPKNADYGHLALSSLANSKSKLPFSYVNMSLRIAKEIKQKIRIAVNAYNFLNIRYRYYNPDNNSVSTYSYPTSVGAELSIKF